MRIRADQIRVGDRLQAFEVLWVLPTPDRRSVVLGLKSMCPRRGGVTRVTTRYAAQTTVTVFRSSPAETHAATSLETASPR